MCKVRQRIFVLLLCAGIAAALRQARIDQASSISFPERHEDEDIDFWEKPTQLFQKHNVGTETPAVPCASGMYASLRRGEIGLVDGPHFSSYGSALYKFSSEKSLPSVDSGRFWYVYPPKCIPTNQKDRGLVMFLHGYGQHPSTGLKMTRMMENSEAYGFVAIAPSAKEIGPDKKLMWDAYNGYNKEFDFLKALFQKYISIVNAEKTRRILVGYSMGTSVANRLACRTDLVGGLAVFASRDGKLIWTKGNLTSGGPKRTIVENDEECAFSKNLRVIQHNNIYDPAVRILGTGRYGAPDGGAVDRWIAMSKKKSKCKTDSQGNLVTKQGSVNVSSFVKGGDVSVFQTREEVPELGETKWKKEIFSTVEAKCVEAIGCGSGQGSSTLCSYHIFNNFVDKNIANFVGHAPDPRWLKRTWNYVTTGKLPPLDKTISYFVPLPERAAYSVRMQKYLWSYWWSVWNSIFKAAT